MVGSHAQLPHPVRLGNVVIHRQRDNGFEFAPVFLTQRNKAERLQVLMTGCSISAPASTDPGRMQEHHFDLGTLRQRTRQREQTSSQGNTCSSPETLCHPQSEHGGSVAFKVNPRSSRERIVAGGGRS